MPGPNRGGGVRERKRELCVNAGDGDGRQSCTSHQGSMSAAVFQGQKGVLFTPDTFSGGGEEEEEEGPIPVRSRVSPHFGFSLSALSVLNSP